MLLLRKKYVHHIVTAEQSKVYNLFSTTLQEEEIMSHYTDHEGSLLITCLSLSNTQNTPGGLSPHYTCITISRYGTMS